jgi:hypothetical protein
VLAEKLQFHSTASDGTVLYSAVVELEAALMGPIFRPLSLLGVPSLAHHCSARESGEVLTYAFRWRERGVSQSVSSRATVPGGSPVRRRAAARTACSSSSRSASPTGFCCVSRSRSRR